MIIITTIIVLDSIVSGKNQILTEPKLYYTESSENHKMIVFLSCCYKFLTRFVGAYGFQTTIMGKIFGKSNEIKQNWTGTENFYNCFCLIFHCYYKNLIFERKTGN